MEMDVTGKTALITGGGTGIGRASALKLAARGMDIAIVYPFDENKDEALSVKLEIEQLGRRAEVFKADVSKDAEVRVMVKQVIDTFGGLYALYNNAGVTNFVPHKDLDALEDEFWDRAFAVNAKAIFNVSRACAPYLKESKGTIVNTTSQSGISGIGSSIAYCASKAAGINVTITLARVLAPDVRVNSVAPGFVQSNWHAGRTIDWEAAGKNIPLGRVSSPEDVAEVVECLVTSMGYVTGQTIVIDGGSLTLK
jgi:3-oxoacyl-[acyl-carrier protein] reductase